VRCDGEAISVIERSLRGVAVVQWLGAF